jgi:FtsP/CotA-like multicopper oxidase with cupredoxin domain
MPLQGPFAPKGLPGVPALAQPTARRYLTLVEVMDPATGAPAASLLNNLFWEGAPEREQPTVNTVEDWYLINLTADTHPIHLHLVQFHLLDRAPFDAARYTLDSYGVPELMVGDDVVDTGPAGTGNLDPTAYVTGPPVPPPPAEVGWLDTVQAHPGMVTRIRVPFGPEVSRGAFGGAVTHTGRYVWHCHILDHEDNEMMLPYDVVA